MPRPAPEKNGEGRAKARPTAKRKPLSPEEKKRRAEAAAQEKERRAQEKLLRRARRRALFVASLATSLVFVVLYYVFVGVSIATRPDGREDAMPVVIYRGTASKEEARLEVEEVYFKGTYYLPLTVLEPYVTVTEFGDHSTRSFALSGDGGYATFFLNSCDAVICGVRVSLEGESFIKDNVLYLPADFYRDKMNCFTFEKSTALAAWVFTFREETPPAFRMTAQSPAERIPYQPAYDQTPVTPPQA